MYLIQSKELTKNNQTENNSQSNENRPIKTLTVELIYWISISVFVVPVHFPILSNFLTKLLMFCSCV